MDHNHHKGICLQKADELGIKHARSGPRNNQQWRAHFLENQCKIGISQIDVI